MSLSVFSSILVFDLRLITLRQIVHSILEVQNDVKIFPRKKIVILIYLDYFTFDHQFTYHLLKLCPSQYVIAPTGVSPP